MTTVIAVGPVLTKTIAQNVHVLVVRVGMMAYQILKWEMGTAMMKLTMKSVTMMEVIAVDLVSIHSIALNVSVLVDSTTFQVIFNEVLSIFL